MLIAEFKNDKFSHKIELMGPNALAEELQLSIYEMNIGEVAPKEALAFPKSYGLRVFFS